MFENLKNVWEFSKRLYHANRVVLCGYKTTILVSNFGRHLALNTLITFA